MNSVEIAETLDRVDMYALACKTNAKARLTDEENAAARELDARFKEIGKAGHDKDHEIAQFISKVITEERYNYPSELLDAMFDHDTIGEFDDYDITVLPPQNTLVAYEAAKGGNVDRSFLDISKLTKVERNLQLETEISFAEVRRGGWKTIALLTQYAQEALDNKKFKIIFDLLDASIASGAENYLLESSSLPTAATMDAMALYLMEHSDNGSKTVVGLTKYIQAISKLQPYIAAEQVVQELRNAGLLGYYDGCALYPINSTHKVGNTELLFPDKKLYGIAGKIGVIDDKGTGNIYQHEDTNKEKFHLKFADFSFGVMFNKDTLDKVFKVVLA